MPSPQVQAKLVMPPLVVEAVAVNVVFCLIVASVGSTEAMVTAHGAGQLPPVGSTVTAAVFAAFTLPPVASVAMAVIVGAAPRTDSA